MSAASSSNGRPGAVAVDGMRETEPQSIYTTPPPDEPRDASVEDLEAASSISITSRDQQSSTEQQEDETSVVRKQQPVVMETMIQAELVTPPVEALRVCIDEEYDPVVDPAVHYDSSQSHSEEMDYSHHKGKSIFQQQWGLMHWILLAFLLLLVLCAVLVPVALLRLRPADSAEAVPSFPYSCYRNTIDILEAQISAENAFETELVLIMCPGTRLDVGVYKDPEKDDLRFVDGDYPLVVIRPNVTIQCGLDGKQENECVLDGGMVQVSTFENVTLPNGTSLRFNNTVDNMTVRGMTFTGTTVTRHPFNGVSVSLSHPGKNIRFEDCRWTDMTALRGVVRIREDVYRDNTMFVGDAESGFVFKGFHSIQSMFSNCVFDSIVSM